MYKAITLSLLTLVLTACAPIFGGNRVVGSGKVVKETREVSGYDAIELYGVGDATIVQGDNEGVIIEAEDNLLPYLVTEVIGGELRIGFKNEGVRYSYQPTKPIKYTIQVKDIARIRLTGSANVNSDKLESSKLDIDVSGSGKINIQDLKTDSMKVGVSGSGDFQVAGVATEQSIKISGSSNYKAADLECVNVTVNVTGSGNVTIWAKESLDVQLSGSSNISYYGSPKVTQSVTGSAKIKSLGAK